MASLNNLTGESKTGEWRTKNRMDDIKRGLNGIGLTLTVIILTIAIYVLVVRP